MRNTIRSITLLCLPLIFSESGMHAERMKPIKKPGVYGYRYYSSENDNHEFMNTAKIARWAIRLFTGKKSKEKEKKTPKNLTSRLEAVQTVPVSQSIKPQVTWIGHASFLIQINNFNIITDPIFGDINALNDPLFWFNGKPVRLPAIPLTKRAVAPGIKIEDVPSLDAIVISHDHSDHMDADALIEFAKNKNTTIFIPEGKKALMLKFGFEEDKIVEHTWWEATTLKNNDQNITLTCLPACHSSIRFSPLSYRESLWASWMISSNGTNIYFAGDTSHGPHFEQIAQEFSSIDIALMPIGPTYEGENKAKSCHTDSDEAIDAFIELKAKYFIPMHYGTFAWGNDHLYYPFVRLPELWNTKVDQLKDKELVWLGYGKSFSLQ